jgi:hypothetical protein
VQHENFSAELGRIEICQQYGTCISIRYAVSLRHKPIPTLQGM